MKAFIFCWIEFSPLPYLFVNALDNQSYSLWFPLQPLPTILLYGSHSAYVSTFAKPSLTALILALYNSHYDEYIVIALHLICKLLFTLLQKCIAVFENVLYVSTHCIFWIFEKHTVREYLPYTSNKRKSLKNEKSFVRSRISQENIQSKILHLSSHFCSQLSSKNVLHKSFESCIFAWVCLHRNYILLQLLEVCSFFYGQNFSHLLQK